CSIRKRKDRSNNNLWCGRLACPGSRDGCTTKTRSCSWTGTKDRRKNKGRVGRRALSGTERSLVGMVGESHHFSTFPGGTRFTRPTLQATYVPLQLHP